MFRTPYAALAAAVALTFLPPAVSAAPKDPEGIARLVRDTGGRAKVSTSPATGAVRFISLADGRPGSLAPSVDRAAGKEAAVESFVRSYGRLMGVESSADIRLMETSEDSVTGSTRLSYQVGYRGVPVFGGVVRFHFNKDGELRAVNGNAIPDLSVETSPVFPAASAGDRALASVREQHPEAEGLAAGEAHLVIYRQGLVQGIAGANRLAWQFEAGNGDSVRELYLVDAISGKILDHFSKVHEAGLTRKVYEQTINSTPVWVEGDAFPFQGVNALDINNIIEGSRDAYVLLRNVSAGRDSYDGNGATMHIVNNDPTISCPNANWNGVSTNYCNGVTSDDVVAHEWGHAYTEYTSSLIYAWQPGALNESYSDVWGETADLINRRQNDTPDNLRAAGACSNYTALPNLITVNSPTAIAGDKTTGSPSGWGPSSFSPLTGNVVQATDGTTAGPLTTDGCGTITNPGAVAGNIAIVDRGTCSFKTKAFNVQAAGAIGFIVANNTTGVINMGNDAAIGDVNIPGGMVSQADGNAIKANLGAGVNVTIRKTGPTQENSRRWLIGEDSTAFGGAIRDMWNPNCYSHAARVLDTAYHCATSDAGGVHLNSGVPNHAYALLVDGGTFNGQTIAPIGLNKAAALWWRAQSVYLTEISDFSDFADALEASCRDLVGTNVRSIESFALSGETMRDADCSQVTLTIAATELRATPTCTFTTVLNLNEPALCPSTNLSVVGTEDFDGDPFASGWTVSNVPGPDFPNNAFVRRLWPDRPGYVMFARNSRDGDCVNQDLTAETSLTSPAITVPASARVAFEHAVTTEAGWDGGILEVSVNGGTFTQVPSANMIFNSYNSSLFSVAQGNTNPLANASTGRPAWTGAQTGSVVPTFGQTQANLTGLANAGDSVRFRWRFGQDLCGGEYGWAVDNVLVYSCNPLTAGATLSSPANNATLATSQAFTWNAVGGASEYWLTLGTEPNSGDIYSASQGTATTRTVTIPATGQAIYGRLWTLISGNWTANEYNFYGPNPVPGAFLTPVPGSTLTSASTTFTWSPGTGVTQFWLQVGRGLGGGQYFDGPVGTNTSQVVSTPQDGGAVNARLWSFIYDRWYIADAVYQTTTPNAGQAAITAPTPGSTLTSQTVTFTWGAATGANEYWLTVGTEQFAGDLFDQSAGLATSQVVSNLPRDGGLVYVRLWTRFGTTWHVNNYTYRAVFVATAKAEITSPTPGSGLSNPATFTWNTGLGVSEYWFTIGTSLGTDGLIFSGSMGTATTKAVSIPYTDGRKLFVRLWSLIDGDWYVSDYTYVAPLAGTTVASTGAVTINTSGAANPYPSTITVPTTAGNITKLRVNFTTLIHANPQDLDILLVGPGGQRLVLMSDGGGTSAGGGAILTGGVSFSLDDAAAISVPQNSNPTAGSIYQPVNYTSGDTFPSPAPTTGTLGTLLSVFNGTNPTGTWSLYVTDDATNNGGSLASWSLQFLTN